MIEDKKLECHECDGVVKTVPESVEALGEAFNFQHLCQDHGYFCELVAGGEDLLPDDLGLEALEGVGDQFCCEDGDVDGCKFMQEAVVAEIEVDDKHF